MSTLQDDPLTKSAAEKDSSLFWTVVFCLPPVVFVFSWGLYELVIRHIHYGVGAVLTFFFAIAVAAFIFGIFQFRWVAMEPRFSRRVRIGRASADVSIGVASVLLLITICAWVSYCLLKVKAFAAPAAEPTYAAFIDFYSWHLVDLIPGMNAEKTLGLKNPPLELRGWIAAAPVLLFRLLVAVVGFTAIKNAWTAILDPSPTPPGTGSASSDRPAGG